MAESTFVYVTYIRTTPEKLWWALTDMEFIKQWWFGVRCESHWKAGSKSASKLAITHTIKREPSKLIAALSNAWPMAIPNLKSLLENGAVVLNTHP